MTMDAPERGALMLIRVVAAALIGWAVADIALYCVLRQHKNLPVEIIPCILKSISAVAGIIILIKAKSIAEWISEKLDE
jgi:uncharacterized membrane protein HdeD (DUF308 family)